MTFTHIKQYLFSLNLFSLNLNLFIEFTFSYSISFILALLQLMSFFNSFNFS